MKNDEIEILDFNDESSLKDKTEVLDFAADIKISNEIDEMLDFFDINEENTDEKVNQNIDIITNLNDNNNVKIELDADKQKLEEYIPSIKDFNIKSAKLRKVVYKSMLYVVIIMLLGFEMFLNKTGDILSELRVYASNIEPIRIVQNEKYGYIDYNGKKIVNPKYIYGEDFVESYAIVKNSSNLPLIIDKGGKEAVSSGKYFSLYRADKNIIVSKVTNSGLKYGMLDEKLKFKTKISYDLISYDSNVYTFVKGNTVGIINYDGNEIFRYKLSSDDDKKIIVNVSKTSSLDYEKYGVVTVNSTSQIINLNTGKVITSATLNEIVAEENNVFYEKLVNGNKRYLYIQNDEVILESDNYASLYITSLDSGVLKAIDLSYKYEFISISTKEQLKKNLDVKDVYEGDSAFIYKSYNYKRNKYEFVIVKNGKVHVTVDADFEIYKGFKNGIAIVKYSDGKYGYINSNGKFISDNHFLECMEFDSYGDAVAKLEGGYGVINKNGKTVIKFENENIIMALGNVKKASLAEDNNIFYAVLNNGKYNLYNSNAKRIDKINYDDVVFDDEYNILKVSTDMDDSLIIAKSNSKINLTSSNIGYKAYDNYILIKNEYYNYEGKMIYLDSSKGNLDNE